MSGINWRTAPPPCRPERFAVAYRLVLGYALVRRGSEQNSSLQLIAGRSSRGLQLGPISLRTPLPCDRTESDTFESVKRREFVPFALAACLAAAV
jgi:hypothetical protein